MDQVFSVKGHGASPTLAMAAESDPQIISMVRQGVTEAFDVLYERHVKIALYLARSQADNPSDADDVVAESFAAIFQLLIEGKGPKEFFRSYLLTVVRRTAHDRNRKARRTPIAADDSVLDSAVLDNDPVLSHLESSIMAKAFKSLPQRWQAVLWHLDIEGLKPAAAAPLVGLTPNGVSSLALRAREGLRQAYLQQHISQTVGDGCEEFASQLGKYARNALKRTSEERVNAHLDGCAKCTALLMELNDVQGGMRAILFPLVTGISFTPAALAALGSSATTAAVLPAAGGADVAGQTGSVFARSAGQAWKVSTAIIVGVLALAGVLAWLLQPNAATESVVAGDAGEKVPPVHASSSPATPDPGTMTAPTTAPGSSAAPPDPTRASPKEAPVPAETSPAGVVIPPAQEKRSAVVVDSGLVSATTPAGSQSAAATLTVDASFSSAAGSGPAERELRVEFSLEGDGSPTTGEAVFTLPDQATFVAGRTVSPSGWTCTSPASDPRHVRCVTSSLTVQGLAFKLGVAMPENAGNGMLNYRFGGQGIAGTSFANAYH
ncbi:sigma-70 family RNA polymerase sigma factor [Paenarthrobacter aurescens]|nr:sigma-70 family RNA polymerase sigma factor [Paenarthrobacter aurescens]MDO6141968.1 sigma-70 family RNA polymerase sigma factor [Paenarthrobacter aurescens]MDO6145773.1 sigma-70 family RNA polymerase sigma factor [Paenarthrobacter aurescens]MDO6157017.1 sigma-70 family RNA polymerase sigma factor [Paenarthrobacter aurescens]MDO6161003.1 sigma-70 family RNA polymerase sigma factor [Paenarthrobacter aurescens]